MSETKFNVGDHVILTEVGKCYIEREFSHSLEIVRIDTVELNGLKNYTIRNTNGKELSVSLTNIDLDFENKRLTSAYLKMEMFRRLTRQMLETFKKKNADYGDSTTQTFKEFGLTSYAIRLNDKLNRIKSFCKKGELEVNDESCIDTLLDMSAYCLLAVIDLKDKENEQDNRR